MNSLLSILVGADVVVSTIRFVTTVSFDNAVWLAITHSSKINRAAILTGPVELRTSQYLARQFLSQPIYSRNHTSANSLIVE